MLSNVFLPITMTFPVVIFLNHLKSSGRCHGILFPLPITRFSLIAAIALKCFIGGGVIAHRLWRPVPRNCATDSAHLRSHCPTEMPGLDRLCFFGCENDPGYLRN